MKIDLFCAVALLGSVSLAASAEEASSTFSWGEVIFQPRVFAGYADYELKSDTFTYTVEGIDFPANLVFDTARHDKIEINGPVFGVGITVAASRFFGDFYYQSTLNETAYSSREVEEEGFIYNDSDVKAQHADWAISLGYSITDQWSVFLGYKSGNTDWDQSFQGYPLEPRPDVTNLQGNLSGEFDQQGPFIGASYSLPIGPGALTFKAAYAYLDGTVEWNYRGDVFYESAEPVDTQTLYYKLDGNSNAYSLGISWTQPITDNLGYSIGVNYHRYSFDLSGSATLVSELGEGQLSDGTLTESLLTVTAAMAYRF